MKYVITLLICCSVLGCTEYNDPKVLETNKATLSTEGEFVGKLPDGRSVMRYKIEMGDKTPEHWIYVTSNVVTINTTLRQGKATKHQVEVIIDGTRHAVQETK